MTRWTARASALVLWAALAAAGCGRAGETPPADPLMDVFRQQAQEEGLTRTETDGKRLFAHYCATCHGAEGAGDGQNAFNLDPAPADFHTALAAHPTTYWRQIIEGGTAAVGRSALCPPWGRSLSPSEIDALLAHLAVLARPPAPSAPAGPS